MTLVTQFLAVRRDRLLMRLGCWLVCFSLIVGLTLPQQRAYAVEPLTMTAVAGLAAAYLGACGLTFVVSGMDKDALVSSVQRLIQEFLDTELGGVSIQDWLGAVWSPVVMAGKLILGRPLTNELMGFAQWVAGKYGTQVGMNAVYQTSESYVTLADGSKFYLCTGYNESERKFLNPGTPITRADFPVVFSTGYYMDDVLGYNDIPSVYYYDSLGEKVLGHVGGFTTSSWWPMYVGVFDNRLYFMHPGLSTYSLFTSLSLSQFDIGVSVSADESFGVDRAPSMSYIPEGIAAEQGIALDVGAAATMGFDQVVQGVLEGVVAGTLEATMEAAGEIAVDPPAGEITDVDNLGLPALGQALTSRFPFSIPWDFFRAVQLLAAPAKAPYFEVDFLKPIEHRVGKWQGSTTVVLDFSQYAIIGQVSRWTSTIGFCLMLASATKRLIWTA